MFVHQKALILAINTGFFLYKGISESKIFVYINYIYYLG